MRNRSQQKKGCRLLIFRIVFCLGFQAHLTLTLSPHWLIAPASEAPELADGPVWTENGIRIKASVIGRHSRLVIVESMS